MNRDKLLNEDELNFSHESLLVGTYYNLDFKTLESMGYKRNMIKKVYAFLRPATLERAINLMTKENGKYPHKFMKDIKHNKKTCYICGESPLNHIDYKPEKIEKKKNNNNNNINNNELIINLDNIQNDFTCPICGDLIENNKNNVIKLDKCGDEYCINCWYNYIQSKIEEGYVNIKCMNFDCQEILNKEFIMKIIKDNDKLIKKYDKFSKKLEILNNPNKKFCPYKNCDSYGEKIGKDKYIKCKNGHKFCFICLKEWHGNKPCEKKEDEEINKWKKDKILKKCPNCKIWTEKNEGCNHMTCAECKYQWCWLCNQKYTINHYKEGKCNGLLFYKPSSDNNPFNQNDINLFKINQNKKNEFRINQNKQKLIHPNNKKIYYNDLQDFINDSLFGKFIFILLYYIFTFEFIAYNYFFSKYDNEEFFFIIISLIIYFIYFFLFLIFKIILMTIILIPSLFYYPFIKYIYQLWFNHIINF